MKYHKNARPLPWYGGKQSKAKWLYSLIPWRKDSLYCEPFGGMAGLLCYRAPVKCEIFNDLDGRIVNWWKCVRDQPKELGRLVEGMPHSEAEYRQACITVTDESAADLERALAFYVLANQSTRQNMNGTGWQCNFGSANGVPGSRDRWRSERVAVLSERLWNVQLFCRPAEKILERIADIDNAVIYMDPPYLTADTSGYAVCEVDVPALSELLLAQRGQVAISGYGDEWEHLGWQRNEFETTVRDTSGKKGKQAQPRTEVLWTNYDAVQAAPLVLTVLTCYNNPSGPACPGRHGR